MEPPAKAKKKMEYPPAPPHVTQKSWDAEMRRIAKIAKSDAGDQERNAVVTHAVEDVLRFLGDDLKFTEWLADTRRRLKITETMHDMGDVLAWSLDRRNRVLMNEAIDAAVSRLRIVDEIRPAVDDALRDLVLMGDARPRQSRFSTPLAVVVPTGKAVRDGRAVNRNGVVAWVAVTPHTTEKDLRVVWSKIMGGLTPVRGFGVPEFSEQGSYAYRRKREGKTSEVIAKEMKAVFGLKSCLYMDVDRMASRHCKALRGIVNHAADSPDGRRLHKGLRRK